MTKAIFVLGPSRSGTSAVAGVLHHLGVNMGDDLMPPSFANPKGHYEDMDWFRLNQRIAPMGYPVVVKTPTPLLLHTYRTLIKDRNEAHRIWGVKDPRLCMIAQYILPMVEDAHLLFVERPTKATVDSLVQRDRIHRKQAEDITLQHIKGCIDLRHQFDNLPTMAVSYNELVDDPEPEIIRIVRWMGELPNWKPVTAAIVFIDPELRHHT